MSLVGGSSGLVVMGDARVQEVVGLNLSTRNWVDIFGSNL